MPAADPRPKLHEDVDAAREALSRVRLAQLSARERLSAELAIIAAAIAALDEAAAPAEERLEAAIAALADAESRTLGPWVGKPGYWQRYVAGQNRDCWSSVAWLRLPVRDERTPKRQWELQLRSPRSRENRDVCFGPPTGDPSDDDKLKALSDELLAEAGWLPL